MKRLGLVAVILVLAVAGCSKDADPAATPTTGTSTSVDPTDAASPSTAASPSSDAVVFTVDGGGPYEIGATLTSLKDKNLLDAVSTTNELCPTNTYAKGTGDWKDLNLSFRPDGKLYMAVNRSAKIPTPSGAWLGMTMAAIQSIYGTIGKQLDGGGGAVAFLVTTDTGQGLLFDFDQKKKVMSMIAGDATYLKDSYLGGTDFC
ncbi:hypothetical protein F4553_001528 [Allocatelliglobosispora scoriae]|uniref:Uncharacterized protein n=1 Tax=Allocatelliglobosispora scoriae TaxID=643052 RepID=A0A841BLS9_9ACTN|nr:hypothetical protein [Allocatelliglobosispora scoriae]MBB5868149.1 hypothetical protein [Allocatelliglobosispora scoriae]